VSKQTMQPSLEMEQETPVVETWHNPTKVVRLAFWSRVAARVFLVLIVVTVLLVGWDVFSRVQRASVMDMVRTLVGQYVGFASLFMAVVVFEALAYILEILLDIEENTRGPRE